MGKSRWSFPTDNTCLAAADDWYVKLTCLARLFRVAAHEVPLKQVLHVATLE